MLPESKELLVEEVLRLASGRGRRVQETLTIRNFRTWIPVMRGIVPLPRWFPRLKQRLVTSRKAEPSYRKEGIAKQGTQAECRIWLNREAKVVGRTNQLMVSKLAEE